MIFLGSIVSNKAFKLSLLKYFNLVFEKSTQSRRMCLTVKSELYPTQTGASSFASKCLCVSFVCQIFKQVSTTLSFLDRGWTFLGLSFDLISNNLFCFPFSSSHSVFHSERVYFLTFGR